MTDQMTGNETIQRIKISNLPANATEVQLRVLFLVHGRIDSYVRPVDAYTRRGGAIAFMGMAPRNAAAAIEALNGHQLDGQALRVSACLPSSA